MIKKLIVLLNNIISLRTLDFKIIKLLWNECPILIEKEYLIGRAAYQYNNKTFEAYRIIIGIFPTKTEMHTALLHEIGHYKDHLELKHKYNSIKDTKLEKTAWKIAIRLAKQYNIDIDYSAAANWLKTYGTEYRCLNNKITVAKKNKIK